MFIETILPDHQAMLTDHLIKIGPALIEESRRSREQLTTIRSETRLLIAAVRHDRATREATWQAAMRWLLKPSLPGC